MDRFIVSSYITALDLCLLLKSNMDRFIVWDDKLEQISKIILKSNMDRFIDLYKDYNIRNISF